MLVDRDADDIPDHLREANADAALQNLKAGNFGDLASSFVKAD